MSVRSDLAIGPGNWNGRGVIQESCTCLHAPPGWQGGRLVHRVALDHGPTAWVFAETLRRPPEDTYERAWTAPDRFWADVLALTPLERARALHFLGLRGGGALQLPSAGGLVVSVESGSAWLYGLFRRLPLDRATMTAIVLLGGWQADAHASSQRFGHPTSGRELAAGDVIEGYQFECYAPTAFVLGALTLLLAEHRVRVPVALEAGLRQVLTALPADLFGYSSWRELAAYPRAACGAVPPPLPDWVLDGHPASASALGLAGSWIAPSDADLYCP